MLNMNYIKEMNAFFDWLETNPLEASTQTLWFHLMGIANKSGWPEWFAVANPLLQAKVGLSEGSLNKHRNILEQKGRIEYRSQGRKKPGKYRIIPFIASNFEVIHEVNREVMGGVIREVNRDALNNKLKELNNTATTRTREEEPQTVGDAYCQVFGKTIIPPNVQSFIVPIIEQHGEAYAIELVLETGEAANKPSLRYMQQVHASWQSKGISSRAEAAALKEQRAPPKPTSITSALPLVTLTDEERAEMERIADAQRLANLQRRA